MRKLALLLVLVLFPPVSGLAQQKLPEPLKLPPGLEQTLPISKAGSYLSDATRIQDCPEDKDNPLGLCNNVLFGGSVLFVSGLSGNIRIRFSPPVDNIAKFEIFHLAGLKGDDVIERAPILYAFPMREVLLVDGQRLTTGEVDLTTGEVRNLNYVVKSLNNKLRAYLRLFPVIKAPELNFPGIYGTAIARFDQRPDGLLDFTFFGSTFVPTGNNLSGLLDDKVRALLPWCPSPGVCPGMEAPGTTLRPRVRISTRDPEGPECGANCPDIPFNSIQVFTASAYHSSMGDRFTHLDIPELGGPATGWSHLSGRLYVQFGDRYGDLVPVVIWALVPEGTIAEPPPSPIPGFGLNMLGVDGRVQFPNFTYVATDRIWVNDPFDFAVGVFNVKTGKSVGDFVYRGLPFQTLFVVIQELNAGRIPQDTFRYQGPASFERGPNGSLIFRYDGEVFLDFSTFLWPTPDYNPARGFRAGPGSLLNPFTKFQATTGGVKPVVVKSGEINERSSFGDQVGLRYSIPCDVSNKVSSFEYTNSANATRGGTFRMETLAAVTCTNARGSTAQPGGADIVTFSGFGSWSKDSAKHLATVQISTAADSRFWIVQIDGGLVSNADTIILEETYPSDIVPFSGFGSWTKDSAKHPATAPTSPAADSKFWLRRPRRPM